MVNALTNLPPDVKAALRSAGWKKRPSPTFPLGVLNVEIPPLALGILSELYMVRIDPVATLDSKYPPQGILFNPIAAKNYIDEIKLLSRFAMASMYPLGEVGNGSSILVIAQTGHCFLLGCEAYGLYLAGSTFGSSAHNIIHGYEMPIVEIELDSDNVFGMDNGISGNKWIMPRDGLKERL